MNSVTVIKCLNQLFTLCGYPSYVLSDCGSSFLSQEVKNYLTQERVATSKTTPTTLLAMVRLRDTMASFGRLIEVSLSAGLSMGTSTT